MAKPMGNAVKRQKYMTYGSTRPHPVALRRQKRPPSGPRGGATTGAAPGDTVGTVSVAIRNTPRGPSPQGDGGMGVCAARRALLAYSHIRQPAAARSAGAGESRVR